LSILLIYQ